MAVSTSEILGILAAHDIFPYEDEKYDIEFPGIGDIGENETVYSTSVSEVFGEGQQPGLEIDADLDDPRWWEWTEEIEDIIGSSRNREGPMVVRNRPRRDAPEPYCAWYCPIHFYGHGWGIYIRENCIMSQALDIATFVDWSATRIPSWLIRQQLLRSAFYVFFLHEQFHHKVESLGFRLLISTGNDRYREYKRKIYRHTYGRSDCLEESLANAESYRRLSEKRYLEKIDPAIRKGLRIFLKASFALQPPGYREGLDFLADPAYREGIHRLHSQVRDGALSTPKSDHWSVAANMITSLANINEDIYVVLPTGGRPIFRPTSVDPGATASTRAVETALIRHYNYVRVPGGKGSHVKMKRKGWPTITLPGNRSDLSRDIIKHVLDAVGGHPISRLKDFLNGTL